jgi:hypothetical protein
MTTNTPANLAKRLRNVATTLEPSAGAFMLAAADTIDQLRAQLVPPKVEPTALRPPYCPRCDRGIPANHITADQRHDTAAGGCGGPIYLLPDRHGLPPGAAAIGLFAKMGARWVLQWPPSPTVMRARQSAAMYSAATVLELRPLYDGNPADVPLLALVDQLTEDAGRWRAWCEFTAAQDEPARLAMEVVIGPILDAGRAPTKPDLDKAMDAAIATRSPAAHVHSVDCFVEGTQVCGMVRP